MLPEAGAFELIFLAAVALIVVGPKDLPVLLRKVGQFTAKMRGLAAEFRSSFDEMARQSELDELRKEVDALRNGQIGAGAKAEVESHFKDINDHLSGRADAAAYHEPWSDSSSPPAAAPPLSVTDDGDETPELPFPAEPHPAQPIASAEAKGVTATTDEHEIEGSRAPLIEHLVELRTRLIVCVAALVVGFVICFVFSVPLYLFLMRPYQVANALIGETHIKRGPFDLVLAMVGQHAIHNVKPVTLIFTGPLEFFFTKMKLAAFGAVVITFPILAWQLYRFVAPGLYKRERNAFYPFLMAAPILFTMGAALVYFVMLPFVLWFSLSQQISTPEVQVQLLPKVSDYLELVTKLLLAFGLCFQLPVVLSLAGLAGLVGAEQLGKFRRYAIVGIVFVAALVTPPDPVSQCLLAIPIYALYEISILSVKLIERRRRRDEAREAAAT